MRVGPGRARGICPYPTYDKAYVDERVAVAIQFVIT